MVERLPAGGAVAPEHARRSVIAGWSGTRVLAGAIGVGSVGLGSFQYGVPQRAARRFGIRLGSDPSSTIMMRGAGARDCLTGIALLYSAAYGGDYRPWLAMRAAADAADGIAGALTLRAGTRCARQARTMRLALLLSCVELLLWRSSRGERACGRHAGRR